MGEPLVDGLLRAGARQFAIDVRGSVLTSGNIGTEDEVEEDLVASPVSASAGTTTSALVKAAETLRIGM